MTDTNDDPEIEVYEFHPTLKSVTQRSCGCRVTEYHDAPDDVRHCLAHALYYAGELLREAGERMMERDDQ